MLHHFRTVISRKRTAAGAAIALVAAVAISTAIAQDQAAAPENPTVATVNGEDITQMDLQMAAQDFRETLMQLPASEQLMGLVNGIIDIKLMARAAEKEDLAKDADATRRLQFVRDRALRAEYLRVHVFDAITDEAVKAKYDAEVAKFVPVEEVKASHILVASEDEAKAIIAELDGGADFAKIAKEKSVDLGSGANGGDLGFFTAEKMVKPFADAAFALEPGTYTKTPVKSDFGYHVILLVEKRMSVPPTLEQRTNAIREEVARDLFLAEVEKLRKDAKIELVPPPADAAAPDAEAPAAAPAP
jgi:peptidyl-prolyl cis-trans isomerase C